LLPDPTRLQDFDRQIVEINLDEAEAHLLQPIRELSDEALHVHRLFRSERANEKGNLIADALLQQKALTGNDRHQMVEALL